MQRLTIIGALAFTLIGCSGNTQNDNYLDASFELCNTEVKTYSVSDDGRVRIICADGSKFTMNSEETLEIMRDININYCSGEGLSKFNESRRYYSFQCKSGTNLSINKEEQQPRRSLNLMKHLAIPWRGRAVYTHRFIYEVRIIRLITHPSQYVIIKYPIPYKYLLTNILICIVLNLTIITN